MPTDHGSRRLRRSRRTRYRPVSVTGPLSLSRPTVGVGLHLLSLAFAGTVVRASLAGMTEIRRQRSLPARQHRDLADVPAVEVISRAAVMLMSAAAEKLGLASADPDGSEHRDLDEARRLITALAGLVTGRREYWARTPARCGTACRACSWLSGKQRGTRRAGRGPGEKYTGAVW